MTRRGATRNRRSSITTEEALSPRAQRVGHSLPVLVTAEVPSAVRWSSGIWSRTPGWLFHLTLVPAAVGLLWSHSSPGFGFFSWLLAVVVLGIAAAVWTARMAMFMVAKRRGAAARRLWTFVVAPVGGLLVLALLVGDVPLRTRWALSRDAFADVVGDVDQAAKWSPKRLGLYEVTNVRRDGSAVFFYEKTGALFDDAGFAYLPLGTSSVRESGSFENPQFDDLGGAWYAWTASW